MDPKRLVADGYDRIAEAYAAWVESDSTTLRDSHLGLLEAQLPAGARILDLGCASGVPVARRLAARFQVTGVDISERQVALARRNVPTASFVHGDMAAQEFEDARFDAVVAFFSIFHLPRDEHAALFEAVHGSAPDIAGQGIANPTAVVQSAVMMLRHIGEQPAADRIERALSSLYASGRARTGDLGGTATTAAFTDALCEEIVRS